MYSESCVTVTFPLRPFFSKDRDSDRKKDRYYGHSQDSRRQLSLYAKDKEDKPIFISLSCPIIS